MKIYPLISIVVLNWNRTEETIKCINSIFNQTYKNIEIIIIDNNSTDKSIMKIKDIFPEINLIVLKKNYGCPGGRNIGVNYCKGEYILFLDNDGVLHKDAIKNAVNTITLDPKIAVVSGIVKPYENQNEINVDYRIIEDKLFEVVGFQGGISIHKKEVFLKMGGYPDDYMYGGEETYLALNIMDKNYKVLKNTNIVLWHKKSEKARDNTKNELNTWKNMLATAYQLYPYKWLLIYNIYFWIRYPLYAIKKKIFCKYLQTIPSFIGIYFKYKRKPISYVTYKRMTNINRTENNIKKYAMNLNLSNGDQKRSH